RQKIARKLKTRLSDVTDMEMRLSGGDQSLNRPIGDPEGDEWQELLPDSGPTPEEVVTVMKDSESRSAWLNEALSRLDGREQKIITDRHLNEDVVTLEDLGKELGISKERVRQIEVRAMDKLRSSLTVHRDDAVAMFH
ncbi:MAG: sigma-70 family RNA polymerase sigma factor, partial [Alphaproteobacteria bacterium]|nr:sigma-70 family RNA polymerase sigma factor [Alphaproteobacteria bacterium]